MNLVELLGFMAAVGTTGAFLPQAYKVFKTGRTEDLSLGTFLLMTTGIVLWGIYGFLIHSTPMIVSNLISFTMVVYILIMKLKQS